jgi:hypothetical protein
MPIEWHLPGPCARAANSSAGLGPEAPARIVELMAYHDISELPPLSVRSAPQAASWN